MAETIIHMPYDAGSGLPPGTRLSDVYELDAMIASGGMGEVYKGRQIQTGDPVAIKMIKPELAGNEQYLTLFRREASALHSLYHDSIVRYFVFSVDRAIGRPYLAMEYVNGPSLSDLVKRGPLTFEQVDLLRRRVAAGLQAAHNKGIIHRDMSSDNIILPGGDIAHAKIIDFGIARNTGLADKSVIGDDTFAGKYNYVSPEQAGLFREVGVTNRSDIYSLGLVLAEAVLGRPLDMKGNMADVVTKRQSVPDLSGIDPRLRPLIERMLQPDPRARPASMAEVASWRLEKARPRRMLLLAGVATGVVLTGGAAAAYFSGIVDRAPPIAEQRPKAQQAEPRLEIATKPAEPQIAPPTPSPGQPSNKPAEAPAPPEATPKLNEAPAIPAPPTPLPVPAPEFKPSSEPESLAEEPPLQVPALTPTMRAQRMVRYIRHYIGGPCFLAWPKNVEDRNADVVTFGLSDQQQVQQFKADFRLVNGFDPQITTAQVSAPQCSALAFVQRLDLDPAPLLRLVLQPSTLRQGQFLRGEIEGADRGSVVSILAVGNTGRIKLLPQPRREAGKVVFDYRLEDDDHTVPGSKLLIAVASPKPVMLAKAPAKPLAVEALPAVLDELLSNGGDQRIAIAPGFVRIE